MKSLSWFGTRRAVVRRHAVGEVQYDFVDIAPSPSLRRVVAFDDGMSRRMEMLRRMPSLRLVAAPDMSACAADSQMKPGLARFQALLAAERARGHVAYRARMRAGLRHDSLVPRLKMRSRRM